MGLWGAVGTMEGIVQIAMSKQFVTIAIKVDTSFKVDTILKVPSGILAKLTSFLLILLISLIHHLI